MAEALSKRMTALIAGRESEMGAQPQAGSRPKEMNRNLIFMVPLMVFVFTGCCLFYVWSHHQMISLGYETSQASREEQELVEKNKKLRLELAALKSPSRIERIALQELGLVIPQKEQLIIVR